MSTRAELRALANELRHARTRRLPIEIAERVAHTIVRLERLGDGDSDEARALVATARELLDECKQRGAR